MNRQLEAAAELYPDKTIGLADNILVFISPSGEATQLTNTELDGVRLLADTIERREFIEEGKKYISSLLDSKAQEYGFDNIISARSYAGFLNEYQHIAGELAQWGASVWKAAEDNRASITTMEDLLAVIPKFKGDK